MSGRGRCETGDERFGCVSNSTDVGLFLQKYRRAPTVAATVTTPATIPPTTGPTGNLDDLGVGEIVGEVADELVETGTEDDVKGFGAGSVWLI